MNILSTLSGTASSDGTNILSTLSGTAGSNGTNILSTLSGTASSDGTLSGTIAGDITGSFVGTHHYGTITGDKHEFLFTQQAICIGGIHKIYGVDIDGKNIKGEYVDSNGVVRSDKKGTFHNYYKKGCKVYTYRNGGVADAAMTANDPSRSSALFTNCAFSTNVYRLDRDDPQFSGVPDAQYYIEGMEIHSVETLNGNYFLSATKTYSVNLALILLDYLLSPFGKQLSLTEINLKSFYDSAKICDRIVEASRPANGRILSSKGATFSMRLYEGHLSLDTSKPVRENIETILEVMDMGELVWSGGQYHLRLLYPYVYTEGVVYMKGDVVQYNTHLFIAKSDTDSTPVIGEFWDDGIAAYITDDNISRDGETSVVWPNSQSRLNFATVRYLNEAKNFTEDTVSWPPKYPTDGSDVYATYLAIDNGVLLETDVFATGIVSYYAALAKAEQLVRVSRDIVTYEFALDRDFISLEPNDPIYLQSDILGIPGELLRVKDVQPTDGVIKISAEKFDARNLAWNAKDDEVVTPRNSYISEILNATNLVWVPAAEGASARLKWTKSTSTKVVEYSVRYTDTELGAINMLTEWTELGVTSNDYFEIDKLPTNAYVFVVVAKSGATLADKAGWPFLAVKVTQATYKTFEATVFKWATVVPERPIGGIFNFDTKALYDGEGGIPAGWSTAIPFREIEASQLYSSRIVIESLDTMTGLDSTLSWSAPSLYTPPSTRAVVTVYKAVSTRSVPSKPAGGVYNFDPDVVDRLTPPTGWLSSIPALTAGQRLFTSSAVAESLMDGKGHDYTLQWDRPILYTGGVVTKPISLYKRSISKLTRTALPVGASYSFATDTLSPGTNGWLTYPIGVGAGTLYITNAVASGDGPSAVDAGFSWSTPEVYVENFRLAYLTLYTTGHNMNVSTAAPVSASYIFDSDTLLNIPAAWSTTRDEPCLAITAVAASTLKLTVDGEIDKTLKWSPPSPESVTQRTVALFCRKTTAPIAPANVTYDLAYNNGEGAFTSIPDGVDIWTEIPANGSETLWVSYCKVADTVMGTWTKPIGFVDAVDSEILVVYKRAATLPTTTAELPSGGVYSFDTGTFTTLPLHGWTLTKPEAVEGTTLYQSMATVVAATGSTGKIKVGKWSSASPYVSGIAIKQLELFKRAISAPATPIGTTYSFTSATTGTLQNIPAGWTTAYPTGSNTIYVSRGVAKSLDGGVGVDYELDWTAPQPLSEVINKMVPLVIYKEGTTATKPIGGAYTFSNASLAETANTVATNGFTSGPPTATKWSLTPPTVLSNKTWVCRASAIQYNDESIDESLVWSAPVRYSTTLKTVPVAIYISSDTKPKTPSETVGLCGEYDFDLKAMTTLPAGYDANNTQIPTGWTETPATTGTVWRSTANAISLVDGTGTDVSLKWTAPTLYLNKVISRTVRLYSRTQTTISGSGGYDFKTNTFTSYPTGWYPTIPSGNGILYFTEATAISLNNGTGIDTTLTWDTPQKFTQKVKTATLWMYKRVTLKPTQPALGDVSYNFATPDAVLSSGGWSSVSPSGTGLVWKTSASAVSNDDGLGIDDTLTWSSPEPDTSHSSSMVATILPTDFIKTVTVPLYYASDTKPNKPSGVKGSCGVYSFVSNGMTAFPACNLGGYWTDILPTEGTIWETTVNATRILDGTGIDDILPWGDVRAYTRGEVLVPLTLYTKSASIPSSVPSTLYYNFSLKRLENSNGTPATLGIWTLSPVASSAGDLYYATAIAASKNGALRSAALSWTTPSVFSATVLNIQASNRNLIVSQENDGSGSSFVDAYGSVKVVSDTVDITSLSAVTIANKSGCEVSYGAGTYAVTAMSGNATTGSFDIQAVYAGKTVATTVNVNVVRKAATPPPAPPAVSLSATLDTLKNSVVSWGRIDETKPTVYEVRKGSTFSTATLVGTTPALKMIVEGGDVYWVSAVVGGVYGTPTSIYAPVVPIPATPEINANYNEARNVVISWMSLNDTRNITYEVRKGANIAAASVVYRGGSREFITSGNDTYWVYAIASNDSKQNIYSSAALQIVEGTRFANNVLATIDSKANKWNGKCTGTVFPYLDGPYSLRLKDCLTTTNGESFFSMPSVFNTGRSFMVRGDLSGSGTYTIPEADIIDIGLAQDVQVSVNYRSRGENLIDAIFTQPSFFNIPVFSGTMEGLTECVVQIQTADDRGVFGEWKPFIPGKYNARKFNFRVNLSTTSPKVAMILEQFEIVVDVPDVVQYGELMVPSGGVTIVYPKAYHRIKPNLQYTLENGVAGDQIYLSERTLDSFFIKVMNGASNVSRSVLWSAQGY